MAIKKLPLFSAYGVELEYMIVNRNDLSVNPISDQLIYSVAGHYQNEVLFDPIAWSNELVLHVIELKTNEPAPTLSALPDDFQQEIKKINKLLENYNARLLPTGSHPWMDPLTEARLWPHDNNIIYETYNKIFDCRGHGWSNLQSVHLNLPFANDEEFARLHTAIRLLLPIIPALSASTPIINKKITGVMDTRLEFYRLNQQKIPIITGDVIPELVFSESEYHDKILSKMYQAISKYDPEKILQEEWLNSRGAIARFDRYTIEIRIIDIQECPRADIMIIHLIVAALKAMVEEKWASFVSQAHDNDKYLKDLFLNTIKQGMSAPITDVSYLGFFNFPGKNATVRDLWQHIFNTLIKENLWNEKESSDIQSIIHHGNLSERILNSFNQQQNPISIEDIYRKLAHCLETGELYLPYENHYHL